VRHLVAAPAGCVALKPCEVAAGVHVQEVGLRRVPNVHCDIVVAVEMEQNANCHVLTQVAALAYKLGWN